MLMHGLIFYTKLTTKITFTVITYVSLFVLEFLYFEIKTMKQQGFIEGNYYLVLPLIYF